MYRTPTSDDEPDRNPPPGWYPVSAIEQRYWDGTTWTERTTPLPPNQPVTTAPPPQETSITEVVKGVLSLSILGITAWMLWGIFGPGNGTSEPVPPATTYSSSVESYEATNPATIFFRAKVTNASGVDGTPTCKVRFQDPGGSYSGFDYYTLTEPLPAGESRIFTGDLVITNQGALFVTEHTIECEED